MMIDLLCLTIISISNIPYKNYIVCYYKANFSNNCVINNLNDCENSILMHVYMYIYIHTCMHAVNLQT